MGPRTGGLDAWGLVRRAGLTLALAALFVWLLSARLSNVDPAAVEAAVIAIGPGQWLLALAATAISFMAVGQYDAVVHRHLMTGLGDAVARRAGIPAIAVSQTLGLGVVTGALLRWRMLPGASLWLATRITVAVALSFLAGWAVVTAAVLALAPGAPFRGLGLAGLALGLLFLAVSLWAPRPGPMYRLPPALGRRLARFRPPRWPNGLTLARLVALCALDTFAAAAALWLLLPPGLDLPFLQLLPAFLIAFGAGLVSGAPGGVGAFEIALLALLPGLPETPLLGAVLGWRLVYYALPAALGLIAAAIGPGPLQASEADPSMAHWLLEMSPRAETGIAAQGEHRVLVTGAMTGWLVGRTPHLAVGLFAPLGPEASANPAAALSGLMRAARSEDRIAVVYKAAPRLAAAARARGWLVQPVAREAWIAPRDYDLAASRRAGLRRKLRKAEAAGITVTGPADHGAASALWPGLGGDAALATQLAALARQWAESHGGERGFSMGRFAADYVAGQRLYIAWQTGRPLAFATFHHGPGEWVLDLMRHGPALPEGTMQALIQRAIEDARRVDLPRLSLAAAPESAFADGAGPKGKLARRLSGMDGSGLAQFKAAFAPHWQRLYLLAPTRTALVLAAVELTRAIAAPPPLRSRALPEGMAPGHLAPPLHGNRPDDMAQIDQDDAEFGFALGPAPWQRQGKDTAKDAA